MKPIKLNRRHIVLASITLALATAVGINYWFAPEKSSINHEVISSRAKDSEQPVYATTESDQKTKDTERIKSFFENERNKKERYKKQLSEVAHDDQDYLKKITQEIHQENNIESLIKAKMDDNLIDCIACIGKDGCNVIVSLKTDLTKENVYKIKDIIQKQTDFKNEDIKIVEKK